MSRNEIETASRNSIYLLTGQVSSHVLSLGFVVLAARTLGIESFGCYVSAAAIASWLTIASSFGFDLLVIRKLSRDLFPSAEIFSATLILRVGLWAIGLLILLAAMRLLGGNGQATAVTTLLSLSGLAMLLGGSAASVMAARDLFWPRVVCDLIGGVLRVGCAFAAVRLGFGVIGIAYAVLISSTVAGALTVLYALLRFRLRLIRPNLRTLVSCMREAIPFGIAGIVFALYFRLPLVLLPALRGVGEAGLYGAAFKPIEAWVVIPGSVLGAAYPILARIKDPRGGEFASSVNLLGRLMLGLSLPIAGFVLISAPGLIAIVYGAGYAPGAVGLAILAALFPLIGLNYVLGNALYAAGRPKAVLVSELAGLVAAAVFGVILIPMWGVAGAAASAVLMEAVVVGCNAHSLRRGIQRLSWRELMMPGLPAALVSAALPAVLSLPLAVEALFILFLYPVLFVLLGGVRREDRRWLSEHLPQGALRRGLVRLGMPPRPAIGEALDRSIAERRIRVG